MKALNCVIVIVALGAACPVALAASVAATGKVVGPNSQPQPGVPVQINGPTGRKLVYTDAKGNWSLYNLPPGAYSIQPLETKGSASTNARQQFTIPKTSFLKSILGSQQAPVKVPELQVDRARPQN